MTKIYKARLISGRDLLAADVIEFEGGFWLVPEWCDIPSEGVTMPRRIVSLGTVRYGRNPGGNPEFVINSPIPRDVLEGRAQSSGAQQFVVRELPEIRFPIPKRMN